MTEKNGRTDGETEPVWEPNIIRCEATFRVSKSLFGLNRTHDLNGVWPLRRKVYVAWGSPVASQTE